MLQGRVGCLQTESLCVPGLDAGGSGGCTAAKWGLESLRGKPGTGGAAQLGRKGLTGRLAPLQGSWQGHPLA